MTKFNVNTKIVIIITIGFLVIGNVAISTNIIDLKDLSEKKTDEFQTGCSETIQCSMNEPKGRIDQEKNLNYAIQTSSTIIEDSDEFLEGSLVNLTLDENAHLSLDKIVGVDDWKIMTSSGPSARAYSAMTYDSTIGKIILFGGIYGGTQIYDDTWVYDLISNTWTQMNPSTKPPARCYHSMAFDSSSGKVILFGGRGGPTLYLSDTWVYDLNSNSWTQMTPSTHPSGRAGYSMVYDITSNKVILFGGSRDYTYYADTWAYDHNSSQWTNLKPQNNPAATG
ncbi:MAG: Kelch repeat-containing protein, partial [Candidatus Hodarchaeota archaeon]